jgi:hypothetical protein
MRKELHSGPKCVKSGIKSSTLRSRQALSCCKVLTQQFQTYMWEYMSCLAVDLTVPIGADLRVPCSWGLLDILDLRI